MTPKSLRIQLARDFRINRRVSVVFGPCSDPRGRGECDMDGDRIYIRIAKGNPTDQCFTLVHEWAHAMLFDRYGKMVTGHTNEWGIQEARIIRRYWD